MQKSHVETSSYVIYLNFRLHRWGICERNGIFHRRSVSNSLGITWIEYLDCKRGRQT